MKVRVTQKHPGRWGYPGRFPTFDAGTAVTLSPDEDKDFLGWYECDIAGHHTFVPISFVRDGVLMRDYNPTELFAEVGDVLVVNEIVNAWLLVTDTSGTTGWITAESVVSKQ